MTVLPRVLPLSLALLFIPVAAWASPTIAVTADRPDAMYAINDPIIWSLQIKDDPTGTVKGGSYKLLEGGGKVIGQGSLAFTAGMARIHSTLGEPGTILLEIDPVDASGKPWPAADKKPYRAFGGAAVAWDKIQPSAPRPADFDSWWKTQLATLAGIPAKPVLTREDSGVPNVDYWKVTLDNVNGTHVQGQLARPSGNARCPAMLVVQGAGVYPLQKAWATQHAAKGWLVLDVSAHDQPIDRPKAFYDALKNGALKNYPAIGDIDRDKSYFRRMFLGDIQAARYLARRPDWDGKMLVVTGTSQGGLQSYSVAGLDPQITAMLALVPAGCDDSGALAGRRAGWPFYMSDLQKPAQAQVIKVSAYFDAMNFAPEIHCPVLVGLGLIDQTAPPSGTLAAFDRIPGANKEVVIMPKADHYGTHGTHEPYLARFAAWTTALKAGQSAPVRPSPSP